MTQITDEQFVERLKAFLRHAEESEHPLVPIFKNADGSLDRAKILAEPCFENFKEGA